MLQDKFKRDLERLKKQLEKDCHPMETLYEKKIILEETNEKLITLGYKEDNSKLVNGNNSTHYQMSTSHPVSFFDKKRDSQYQPKSFDINSEISKRKVSPISKSPQKKPYKTENYFYSKGNFKKK